MANNTDYRLSYESRDDDKTLGLDPGAKRDMPRISRLVSEEAADLSKDYGFDHILKSPDGTPYSPLDGAAAFSRAIQRIYGTSPRGLNWQGAPPVMEEVQVQELVYRTLDGREISEESLYDRAAWPIRELVDYALAQGVTVASPFSEYDRTYIIDALIKRWDVVRTRVSSISVPQGAVMLPGTEIAFILTEEDVPRYGKVFRLAAHAKKIDKEIVDEVKTTVLDELQRRSIYKGRCMSTNGGEVAFWCPFAATNADEIILTEEMEQRVRMEVLSIMRDPDYTRSIDPSLLRSKYLAAGDPGTGKTEWTNIVAQWAVKAGITVVKHTPNDPLEVTQRLLGLHAPSLGIIEDIEVYMPQQTDPDYHAKRSDILEQFDGGLAKGREVMFLMTTNYPQMIDYAMSRQGRIDGFFQFASLDVVGFEKLARIKLGDYLSSDIDFSAVWERAGHMSSSFLAGIVKISNRYLIDKHHAGAPLVITQRDLELIISGLRDQWDWHQILRVLNEAHAEPTFAETFVDLVQRGVEGAKLVHEGTVTHTVTTKA